MPRKTKTPLPQINADVWLAMDKADKIEILVRGQCMSSQRIRHVDSQGIQRRILWGAHFEFGSSPVPQFGLEGRVDALSDALSLGACPLARDSEADGPFEYAFRNLAGSPRNEQSDSLHGTMARMCWEKAAPLIDASSKDFIGQDEARQVRFDIALAAYSAGCAPAARELGIPLAASWLLDLESFLPLLRAHMIQWGQVDDLREFHQAGADLLSPMKFSADEPAESLWLWLEDSNPDAVGVGRFLLEIGNDPRIADPTGIAPLSAMLSEPTTEKTALHFAALLLSQTEKNAITEAAENRTPEARKNSL